jgi:hypothetical protein
MQACAAGCALTYATTPKLQLVNSGVERTCHNISEVFFLQLNFGDSHTVQS